MDEEFRTTGKIYIGKNITISICKDILSEIDFVNKDKLLVKVENGGGKITLEKL